ncbi:hypothetical protein GCM10023150_16580 [Kangiella taiwanensis]|uniref:Uncharacterized protein n=1 Tax=Kangiella taiwanensis TaxID=1079179 RepID=A0ABP8I3J2_9GAMM
MVIVYRHWANYKQMTKNLTPFIGLAVYRIESTKKGEHYENNSICHTRRRSHCRLVILYEPTDQRSAH